MSDKLNQSDQASVLLEKALSSFDSILGVSSGRSSQDSFPTSSPVLSAAQALALELQQSGYNVQPDPITADIINTWLESYLPRQDNASDQRVKRLQSDKEALELQVQVLNEQLSSQNDKVAELERTVNEKNLLLSREMLARSSLETQKLELMSAMSELKLQQAALERDNLELRSKFLKSSITNLNNQALFYNKRPPAGPNSPQTNNNINHSNLVSNNNSNSNSNNNLIGGKLHGSHGNLPQSLSLSHKSSPEFYRPKPDIHYSSLPRQSFATTAVLSVSSVGSLNGNGNIPSQDNSDASILQNGNSNKQRNVAFADSDKIIDDSIDIPPRSYTPQTMPSPSMSQKLKGFRGILEKFKGGSNSNNTSLVEDIPEGEFKRGGFRATAGPRLGWSNQEKSNKCFKNWDANDLCIWFEEMGLEQYNDDVRRWLKEGPNELINCAPLDIEKELNLKNPMHRKKICLAVADISGQETDELFKCAGKLDTGWILRWLDDIGLPQYKDEFSAARVDGRVLHKLTMDDLITLHVTSCLHVASLRRGIQIMRDNKWDPECLMRRSTGDVNADREKVVLWTNHCIMEWLRLVDLAEYAPNLRGAGVHGALLMYEVKFTAELLADLLSIPGSKTLLRRHLAMHFKELLGRDIIQTKRDAEATLGFQPLTITAKIKTPKKSQFSLKRKKSSKSTADDWNEFNNFVCPMNNGSGEHLPQLNKNENCATTNNNVSTLNQSQKLKPAQVKTEVASGVVLQQNNK